MAIDCEMDLDVTNGVDESSLHQFTVKNPGLLCKVTLVNDLGEIVLDTLVNYFPQPVVELTEVPKKVKQKKRVNFETDGNLHESTDSHEREEAASTRVGKKRSSSQRRRNRQKQQHQPEQHVRSASPC